jgi:hypothetical protein
MKALMMAAKKRGSVMHANVGISTDRARSETDPRIQSIEQRHWGRRRGISDGPRISSRRDGRSQRVLVEYIDPSVRRNAEPTINVRFCSCWTVATRWQLWSSYAMGR